MARDFAEMEREFLGGLKSETGRDLGEWMAAIAAAGTSDRNATIDWLKAHGFAFNRASWLERIHSNGGRPVYIGRIEAPAEEKSDTPTPVDVPSQPQPAPRRPSLPRSRHVPAHAPGEAPHAPQAIDPASLEDILATAKGYRPLCMLLLDLVRPLVGSLEIAPVDGHLSFRAPAEFAVLAVSGSELRLGLALGDRRFDALAQKARLKGPGSQMTHMVVLNDARQVGNALAELILEAKKRING